MNSSLEIVPTAFFANNSYLTSNESISYENLRTEKRRREWLAGRIAAKCAVRKQMEKMGVSVSESQVEIQKNQDGVPFAKIDCHNSSLIPHPSSLSLSISHSGNWAAAAVSEENTPIGVDIEKVEERHPAWLEIAFHPSENAQLWDAKEQTLVWTLKEAMLKYLGKGLSCDLWDVRIAKRAWYFFSAGKISYQAPLLYGKALERYQEMGSPPFTVSSELLSKEDGKYWVSIIH